MSPSTLHTSPIRKFPGHFRSSPSFAEPASDQPLNIRTRRPVSRPRVPGRGARATNTKIPPKDGQSMNGSPSERRHTAGSRQARSSSDVFRESISLVSSDSEENGEIPDAPQRQPHNNGGYSSTFTPYVAASTHNTLWDVTRTVISPHEQKLGKIYVYRDLNSKDAVYKIGMTTRLPHERVNENGRCCKSEPERVYESNRDIKNCKRLETLIGWDLGHDRMRLPCSNRVHGHEEWFAVSKELAIKTVKQWEDFMDREQPYNAQGNLSIIWRYLLRNRSPKAADIRKLCAKTRHQQWAAILASPTYQDYVYAYLSHAESEYRRFCGWRRESYWILSTVIYGLWTLALSRNVVAFYSLVVVLGCAGTTLIPESEAGSKPKKPRGSSPKKDTPTKA